jgi:alginate O-acetyltransferase complex protein AlgI
MNFASPAFFIFLPIVLFVYHALQTRSRKYRWLLVASWAFYMAWNPWFLWVIVGPTIVDYYAGLWIEAAPTERRRKFWLTMSLIANLGLLAAFKYTAFFMDTAASLFSAAGWPVAESHWRIILPLGISFHTFQGISYTLDVYRRKLPAVRSFTDFALFVAFFPQLVAGPIVRAVEFLPQLVTPPGVTRKQIVDGLHLIVIGLFKKLVIADRLAEFVDMVFHDPTAFGGTMHRWAILAYACQIYCDFSGYSDLAIGCAKWFGFELPENFRLPYLSRSIAEFWRRWHITLSTWIRDYLYVSLGGSRSGRGWALVNLIIAMTLCGLWHGASWNYVLWGLYNGLLLAGHRIWDQSLRGRPWADQLRTNAGYQLLAWFVTMMQFLAGLIFVRAETWSGWTLLQKSLFGQTAGDGVGVPIWVPVLIGATAAGHILSVLPRRLGYRHAMPAMARGFVYAASVALVVLFGAGAGKAFIYFQF